MTPYRATARAPGVWAHQLLNTAPSAPLADVVGEIAAMSVATGEPITAYARTIGGFIPSVLLARDPSVTHGVPDVSDCERVAAALAAGDRWHSAGQVVHSVALVAIGLREGYDPAARVHTLAEFRERLLRDTGRWSGWPAELISARPQPDGTAQVYHEPGVLTFADDGQLLALAAIACDFGQERFVAHDWNTYRTTAYCRAAGPDNT
ncbi:hypothetical protein H4696_009784 [Amycolatopsis lexingtonensis]|uniref:Uncharacterized protein n=1 Tax=Amycolatopsis lexingtonensis TaxID=218822 RepID=A0ABR9IHL1_9PSEU|nr:hypothetical protein [Amycolatopsis lexingtonensis]MBE1502684.1 hypothetical protein [Amycolatopsis lexingtonensis]